MKGRKIMFEIISTIFIFGTLVAGFIKLMDLCFIEYLQWKEGEE